MVTIDLRKDVSDVQAMLAEAALNYSAKHNSAATAKNHPSVSRIDLAFSLGDSESTPWVHLHFDTKPGSEPDGDPTHPDFAKLTREHWLPAVQAVCEEETVSIVQLDGNEKECDSSALTETIGKFLVAMLLAARDKGTFAELPRSELCELGVEDPAIGEFGWPSYEERGMTNLVR